VEQLIIEGSKSTPYVHFDPGAGVLRFQGQSYPENAFKFYEPVFQWVDEYLDSLQTAASVMIELELPYINTSSTKCFMMLLEKFEEAHLQGKKISVQWLCNPDNESEHECAEEFKEDLTLPFEIVAKTNV
jgi:hypothetical protein